MKKYIFAAAFSLALLASPVFTRAAGLTSVQIQSILSLLTSFGADQATIDNVQISLGTRQTETPSSRVSSPSLFTERALQDRKTRLLRLAKTDQKLFFDEVLSKTQRGFIAKELQSLVESEIDLIATIEVLHADDFQNKKTDFQYFLRTGAKRLQLYSEVDLSFLPSGSLVQVKGFQLGDIVVTRADSETFRLLEAARLPAGIGDQKIAVFLLRFRDDRLAQTRQEMHDIIFNGQIQKYFREQSYGHMSLSGDVFDWFAAPRGVSCGSFIYSPEGLSQLIADRQIDLSRYQHLIVVPDYCDGAPGWSAGMTQFLINGKSVSVRMAMVPASVSSFSYLWSSTPPRLFQMTVFDFVFAHEFGHNLGVLHANSWDCATATDPLYGNCRHAEYGNYFDAMGFGINASHFNAKYKEIIGWLNNADVLTIKSSGRYTIGPLEGQSGYRAAKIAVPESSPFYLEYRRPIGFDAALGDATLLSNASGLMINWIINSQEGLKISYPSSFSPYVTRLLDVDTSFGNANSQVSLRGPSVFRDPGRGVTIGPMVRADASGITFDVAIDGASSVCMRKTTVEGNSTSLDAAGDLITWISLGVTNQDTPSCGSSKFSATIIVPPGWVVEGNPLLDPFLINFGQLQWIGYGIKAPSGVQKGSYLITGFITNITANVSTPFTIAVYVVDSKSATPVPTASAPTAVAPIVSSAPIQVSIGGLISQKLHYVPSSNSFYGIGSDNAVWKWDNAAKQWSRITDGSIKDDFHFISESDIYAIGMDNQIWHWNGIRWSQESQGGKIQQKIWYVDGNHIYGIGMDNQVWRYGSAGGWTKITSNGQIKDDFHFVSASEIYGIGLDGQIWKWNGTSWNQHSSGGAIKQRLHVISSTEMYGIGADNRIWGWSNGIWSALHDSGQAKDDFVIVGGNAAVYAIGLDNQIWKLPPRALGQIPSGKTFATLPPESFTVGGAYSNPGLAGALGAFSGTGTTGATTNQSVQSTSSFSYAWNRDLQIGSPYPDDIAALQQALAREGIYGGEITGGFYSQTYTAVQAFQRKYGINATGYVGLLTRAKLNALY